MTENFNVIAGVFSINTSNLTNGQLIRVRDYNGYSATTQVQLVPTSGTINGVSSVALTSASFSNQYMWLAGLTNLIQI